MGKSDVAINIFTECNGTVNLMIVNLRGLQLFHECNGGTNLMVVSLAK